MKNFDAKQIDLAELAQRLSAECGPFVAGLVVGRTRLRDSVANRLSCSTLEAERLVDTMVGRGFLRQVEAADGPVGWEIRL